MNTDPRHRYHYRQPPIRVAARDSSQATPKVAIPVPPTVDIVPTVPSKSQVEKTSMSIRANIRQKPVVAMPVQYRARSVDGIKPAVAQTSKPHTTQLSHSDKITTKATIPVRSTNHLSRRLHQSQKDSVAPEKPVTGRSKRRKPKLLHAVAALVLIVGSGLMIQGFMLNKTVDVQVQGLETADHDGAVTTSSDQLPTSQKPADENYIDNYHVAAGLPRTITIDAIDVHARVLQVGVDKENTMMTPATSYDTAWYNGSSRAGEQGAMIINGHVLGDGGPGIFGDAKDLRVGAPIIIENGDGSTHTYLVHGVETTKASEVDMAKLLVSSDTTKPGLNLITCGGTYIPGENTFDSRTIIYAVMQ